MYPKAYEVDDKGQSFNRNGEARVACYHCAVRARDEYAQTIADEARRRAFNEETTRMYNEAEATMQKMAQLSRDHDEAFKKLFGFYPPV